jgi:hypothetical protein
MSNQQFEYTEEMIDHLDKVELYIHGYRLALTWFACPEQYDMFDRAGNMVAYFRLRDGSFRVDVPGCGGRTVYQNSDVEGDGRFSKKERFGELTKAVEHVIEYYLNTEWYSNDDVNYS